MARNEAFERAVGALHRFDPAVIGEAYGLLQESPDMPMAQALVAYLQLTSTDAADVPGARRCTEAMASCVRDEQEDAHLAVLQAWCAGDWRGAAAALDSLTVEWPADLLALQMGHQLDFFLGDARSLRDRPGRALTALDPSDPSTGYVHGMRAFGLEESGDYSAARAAGLQAVETNADDVWAIHAVAHVHEMEGDVSGGLAFLDAHAGSWSAETFMTVHTWWHRALFLLDAGRVDDVLAIHDREIHHAKSKGLPLELLDGAALLWRLHLGGHDTGTRFAAIADAWSRRTDDEPWYGFNDLHLVLALCGAGRVGDARVRVDRLAAAPAAMGVDIALPASRAIVAFSSGAYDDAASLLLDVRATAHRFGGSHAQRDVLERTLLEAARRAGRDSLARALVSERLARRPGDAFALARA